LDALCSSSPLHFILDQVTPQERRGKVANMPSVALMLAPVLDTKYKIYT